MVQKKMNPKCGSLAKYTHVFLIVKYYRLTERYCFNNILKTTPIETSKPGLMAFDVLEQLITTRRYK
jgi:hypothetical protein